MNLDALGYFGVRTNNLELARITMHQLRLLPELGKLLQHLATLAR